MRVRFERRDASGSARTRRSTASISTSTPASASCCSGRRAAARRRCCACSPGSSGSTPARSGSAIARVDELEPADRDVAMVFQNYALYPHFTVFDNIAFPLRTRRVPADEIERRVREAAARVGLADAARRAARRSCRAASSSASRSRARSSGTPTVYLMDEPLSNLDAQLRLQTRTELKQPASRARHDDDLRHARSGRSDDARRPHRHHAARRDRPGGLAARALPRAGQHVRRDLSRQPADEPADRRSTARQRRARDDRRAARRRRRRLVAARAAGDEARVSVVEPMGSETLVTLDYRAQRLVARVPADRSSSRASARGCASAGAS